MFLITDVKAKTQVLNINSSGIGETEILAIEAALIQAISKVNGSEIAANTKSSISEISNNSKIKVAVCGITDVHIKYYLKRYKNLKFKIVNLDENFDYIIMNNRINWDLKNIEIDTMKNKTCFDKYLGEDIIQIKRRGLILSKLTKI